MEMEENKRIKRKRLKEKWKENDLKNKFEKKNTWKIKENWQKDFFKSKNIWNINLKKNIWKVILN